MSPAASKGSRKGPLFWVLTGGGLFLILLFGGLLLLAYLSGSAQKNNGGLESVRAAIHADPNNEIVEEDPVTGSIHFRNLKTGKHFLGSLDNETKQFKMIAVETDESAKAPEK